MLQPQTYRECVFFIKAFNNVVEGQGVHFFADELHLPQEVVFAHAYIKFAMEPFFSREIADLAVHQYNSPVFHAVEQEIIIAGIK